MSVLRSTPSVVGLAAACALTAASPAAATTSEVHLRAGAEPTAGQVTTWAYGTYGDRHMLCDWDGDGDATLGLYRASTATWYVRQSVGGGNAELTFRYGRPGVGDRVLCGDWDGDGVDTPGLFRTSDNTWHLRNSTTAGAAQVSFRYGRPGSGDTPLVGDWDGDGDDTPGIFRSSDNVWYLRDLATAGDADAAFRYGRPGASDTPLVGDWDGDAIDTPGIFRSADRTLHLRNSNDGGPATWTYPFGAGTDHPLAGDWDGDGRDEPALTREFAPPPPPGTACSSTARRYSYADSSMCLYRAFVRNDRAMAANYATPTAAAELLSGRGTGDPGWVWDGCGEPLILDPSSGVSCTYFASNGPDVHGTVIEFAMARDLRVEDVDFIG